MNNYKAIEKFYRNTPLEKIPWNKTQSDFLQKLLRNNKLGKGTALDLGCGVGTKAIQLAKHGFEVTAVDISLTAIKYAREKTRKEKVRIKFYAKDATDLSFLGNKKYDLILDWANLHGIPRTRRKKYIKGIIEHSKIGSKYVLRCFSKYGMSPNELGFLTPFGIVYLFSREDIVYLYGNAFRIIKTNRSKPYKHPYRWLDEYLMEKK